MENILRASQEFIDQTTRRLSHNVADVSVLFQLPSSVYSLVTTKIGQNSETFTSRLCVKYGNPGSVNRIDDAIGWLRHEISLIDHLDAVIKDYPEIAIVCDNETLQLILHSPKTVQWKEEDRGHYRLFGLPNGTIDVYIPYKSIDISNGSVTTTIFDE